MASRATQQFNTTTSMGTAHAQCAAVLRPILAREIMVIAVIVAALSMMLAAIPLANFINASRTIVMLALGFLMMIGTALIAEGFGAKVPKDMSTRLP
jgi:predicted tellurium resistance membrane protein TerC